ncbi:MAG: thioesterase family protein [Actinomycetota bacterium]|nr:thioesterase family protein [Actinomycetota bacterium]
MELSTLFDLESHGPDTFVGIGPRYPWGGLYGGQIVAQSLRAATKTVDAEQQVHSLRAYFIRRGDHTEPIRFEVDRIRNGRSFSTRRVVARQAVGAILNLEASFHVPEATADVQTIQLDRTLPPPDDVLSDAWSDSFDRRTVPAAALTPGHGQGAGRMAVWMKVTGTLPDDQLLHRCWLAYMSDDIPADAVRAGHPEFNRADASDITYTASLDHSIWFHRPLCADQWHVYDFTSHSYSGARGLSIGHVFAQDGTHVATVAQEALVRDARRRQD